MIPAGQLPELLEAGDTAMLPPPRTDAFLESGVVQLPLQIQHLGEALGLTCSRLQYRLERTEHTSNGEQGVSHRSRRDDRGATNWWQPEQKTVEHLTFDPRGDHTCFLSVQAPRRNASAALASSSASATTRNRVAASGAASTRRRSAAPSGPELANA